MNIYLIGYRCSGKTTIGNALAVKIKCKFLDTDDQMIKHYNGMTIAEIVEKYGWKHFRKKEKEVIEDISLNQDRCIVATGGGIILKYSNIALMKKTGILIWLRARKSNIQKWILDDSKTLQNRPSLTGKNVIRDIEQTFNFRNNIYSSICDFTVLVNKFDIKSICNDILSIKIISNNIN